MSNAGKGCLRLTDEYRERRLYVEDVPSVVKLAANLAVDPTVGAYKLPSIRRVLVNRIA